MWSTEGEKANALSSDILADYQFFGEPTTLLFSILLSASVLTAMAVELVDADAITVLFSHKIWIAANDVLHFSLPIPVIEKRRVRVRSLSSILGSVQASIFT